MQASDFRNWLSGFLAAAGSDGLSAEKVEAIKKHLNDSSPDKVDVKLNLKFDEKTLTESLKSLYTPKVNPSRTLLC